MSSLATLLQLPLRHDWRQRCPDSLAFQLHHRVTALLLLAAAVLAASAQIFGEPILCATGADSGGIAERLFNTYCWTHATFTLPSADKANGEKSTTKHHAYYQWVALLLLFQALCFYFPRWLWRTWEAGRLEGLLAGLTDPAQSEAALRHRIEIVADCLARHAGRRGAYGAQFFFCEALNLVNVVGQFFLVDVFLGRQFISYGWSVLEEGPPGPMAKLFPKLAKCTFHTVGPSGSVQSHDGLCLLAINVFNEKLFLFLWIWLLLLAAVTAATCLMRLVAVISPGFRRLVFYVKLWSGSGFVGSASSSRELVLSIGAHMGFGDFLVLVELMSHLDVWTFEQIVTSLESSLTQPQAYARDANKNLQLLYSCRYVRCMR